MSEWYCVYSSENMLTQGKYNLCWVVNTNWETRGICRMVVNENKIKRQSNDKDVNDIRFFEKKKKSKKALKVNYNNTIFLKKHSFLKIKENFETVIATHSNIYLSYKKKKKKKKKKKTNKQTHTHMLIPSITLKYVFTQIFRHMPDVTQG